MNDRIKELAIQAGLAEAADVRGGYIYPHGMKKFAELIVRECARISNDVDYTMTNQGAVSAQAFMEHLGVEE